VFRCTTGKYRRKDPAQVGRRRPWKSSHPNATCSVEWVPRCPNAFGKASPPWGRISCPHRNKDSIQFAWLRRRLIASMAVLVTSSPKRRRPHEVWKRQRIALWAWQDRTGRQGCRAQWRTFRKLTSRWSNVSYSLVGFWDLEKGRFALDSLGLVMLYISRRLRWQPKRDRAGKDHANRERSTISHKGDDRPVNVANRDLWGGMGA